MTTNNKISPMKFYCNTSFNLPKQLQRSKSVLNRSRFLGLVQTCLFAYSNNNTDTVINVTVHSNWILQKPKGLYEFISLVGIVLEGKKLCLITEEIWYICVYSTQMFPPTDLNTNCTEITTFTNLTYTNGNGQRLQKRHLLKF